MCEKVRNRTQHSVSLFECPASTLFEYSEYCAVRTIDTNDGSEN